MVSDYVKKENKKNKIFVVHRLDQDTSGILMFCKKNAEKSFPIMHILQQMRIKDAVV